MGKRWLFGVLLLAGCDSLPDARQADSTTAPGVRTEIVGGFTGGGYIQRLTDSTTGIVCYGRYSAFSCVKVWTP